MCLRTRMKTSLKLTPQHQHCPRSGSWLSLLTLVALPHNFSHRISASWFHSSDLLPVLRLLTLAFRLQSPDLNLLTLHTSDLGTSAFRAEIIDLILHAWDYKSFPPDLRCIAPGILISSLWPQPFDLTLLTPAFWPQPSVFSLLTSAHWPLPTNLNLGLAAALTLTIFWFPTTFFKSLMFIFSNLAAYFCLCKAPLSPKRLQPWPFSIV